MPRLAGDNPRMTAAPRIPSRCSVLVVALLAAGRAGAAEDLGVVLKKTVEAYGGERALATAKVVKQTGKVVSTMRAGAEGTLSRVYERPDRLRVEISYPGEAPEVRVLDGTRGWRNGHEVSGPPLDAMVLQAARLSLPLLLVRERAKLVDGGLVEREGRRLRAIEVPLGGALRLTAFIDLATFRIVRTAGSSSAGGPGMPGPIEFGTAYSDFRKVMGVWFPVQEATSAMGQHTGDTTLEATELLPKAPEGAFKP